MEQLSAIAQLKYVVLRSLTAKQPVGSIINEACAAAGFQLIILDEGARLLCHSSPLLYEDHIWLQILEAGGIPYSFFLENPRLMSELWWIMKNRKPVRYSIVPETGGQMVFVPMLLQGAFVGHIIAYAGVDYDADFLEQAAQLFGRVYLHKNRLTDRPSGMGEGFFVTAIAWELLASDSSVLNDQALKDMEFAGLRIPALRPPYVTAALHGRGGEANEDQLARLGGKLKDVFPDLFYLSVDHVLLVLFIHADDRRVGEIRDVLQTFVTEHRLYCGVSLCYQRLHDRIAHKAQALDALRLGKLLVPKERVYYARELYPALLMKAAVDKLGWQTLWRSDLQEIVDYDRQNGTAYMHTLEQYLWSGSNHTKAANQLFIDRSTLSYRLAKIKSLIGCDIDDPAIVEHLILAIQIRNITL